MKRRVVEMAEVEVVGVGEEEEEEEMRRSSPQRRRRRRVPLKRLQQQQQQQRKQHRCTSTASVANTDTNMQSTNATPAAQSRHLTAGPTTSAVAAIPILTTTRTIRVQEAPISARWAYATLRTESDIMARGQMERATAIRATLSGACAVSRATTVTTVAPSRRRIRWMGALPKMRYGSVGCNRAATGRRVSSSVCVCWCSLFFLCFFCAVFFFS
jgi:hypothetical protein